jgi:hypothetical protein
VNSRDLPERLEEAAQFRFRRLKIQIADKEVLHTLLTFQSGDLSLRAASQAGSKLHLGGSR